MNPLIPSPYPTLHCKHGPGFSQLRKSFKSRWHHFRWLVPTLSTATRTWRRRSCTKVHDQIPDFQQQFKIKKQQTTNSKKQLDPNHHLGPRSQLQWLQTHTTLNCTIYNIWQLYYKLRESVVTTIWFSPDDDVTRGRSKLHICGHSETNKLLTGILIAMLFTKCCLCRWMWYRALQQFKNQTTKNLMIWSAAFHTAARDSLILVPDMSLLTYLYNIHCETLS